jgi:hypothetical protein
MDEVWRQGQRSRQGPCSRVDDDMHKILRRFIRLISVRISSKDEVPQMQVRRWCISSVAGGRVNLSLKI